ncbi:uncharacterized protein LODBEIA_P15480 [Lodderomyces beijingensis]|uniref:Vacuolar fusion protein MON1 n=1 Tax=Lodderomyces beijingensis TaxID=1775926 RepID=A0ABP0ZHG6_9ASCO
MERPQFSRISTKSTSLLPTDSNANVNSTTDATTAVSYENINSEIQSIRIGSPSIRSIETASISSELNVSEISNFATSVRRRVQASPHVAMNGGEPPTYLDLYPHCSSKTGGNLKEAEYFDRYVKISKSSDSIEFHDKLKHFFIFSTAGKPIYTMNGSDDLVMGYMGILTTILYTFQEDLKQDLQIVELGDGLKLVAMNKAPIILVAISKLPHETDHLILGQLHVLYSYLLSILSKPAIDKYFHNRLNYDLRRILSALDLENLDDLCTRLTYGWGDQAFAFYATQIFNSQQSLRIPYTLRSKMDKILREFQDDELLFSILARDTVITNYIHAKPHNLPDADLSLLLFIVSSLKNKNEDLWVPLCMPNFNKNGFLYVFSRSWNQLTIILISGSKNAFYKLKEIANAITTRAEQAQQGQFLSKFNHELAVPVSSLVPFVVKHFIYVNRDANCDANRFIMSEYPQDNRDVVLQMGFYYNALLNCKSHLTAKKSLKNVEYKKLSYVKWGQVSGFMLSDTSYEFYCITDDDVNSKKLIDISLAIVKWCKKNKSRLFT